MCISINSPRELHICRIISPSRVAYLSHGFHCYYKSWHIYCKYIQNSFCVYQSVKRLLHVGAKLLQIGAIIKNWSTASGNWTPQKP